MSTRSQKIRASRRAKEARRWGGHEKARQGGASPTGLKSNQFEAYCLSRLRNPGRYPEQRTRL